MANKYAGTQTEKNLEAAFAGESQARNKYTYFASKAKKEGFEQISALFQKTAATQPKILLQQQTVRTMSGPICTMGSRRLPTRKVSPNWQPSSAW